MATQAKLSAGTKLQLGDGASPELFTAVAEILTLKRSGQSIKTPDVTNMDSPADGNGVIFEEFIASIATGGDVDFTYNFIPSSTGGQDGLRDAFDGELHNFRIVTPASNAATSPVRNWRLAFAAIVSECDNVDFDIQKQMVGSGKLKISGPTVLE
jgi:hypothetical protein